MTHLNLSYKEKYLRFIETCLFFKGGRWIANFDLSLRDFDISKALKGKNIDESKKPVDALIYGGVRGKGFILSRAFAFLASPTYVVACSVIELQNASKTKWSTIVSWIRYLRALMEIMEFEWSWLVFFGEENLPDNVMGHLKRFNQREIGLVYANLKNKEFIHSEGFIARRGATLFNPSEMDKKGLRLKFWKKE
ncbi:hypothetical protein [Candidatus Hodarchaeum mangrovi]